MRIERNYITRKRQQIRRKSVDEKSLSPEEATKKIIGNPISHAKAHKVALKVMEDADAQRIDTAEKEAGTGKYRQRPSFDEWFMDMAEVTAKRSTCLRNCIGAVITVDNRVVSHGYNGLPAGEPNCIDTKVCRKDEAKDEAYKPCLHAEQNAIVQCAKRGIAIVGGTIYITDSPCPTCAKLIIAAGIEKVVCTQGKRRDGIDMLTNSRKVVLKII
jgi:dCMP deaminase